MRWLIDALSTSVGKKFVMGITGLLLCGFLVVHLAGNVLLYVGVDSYNDYAHALHKNEWLVKIAEAGLVTLFVLHIWLAVKTAGENRRARQRDYAEKNTRIDGRMIAAPAAPENWMFVTGAVVLGFLLLHIWDFTIEGRPDVDYGSMEPHEKAVAILRTPISFWVYLIGCGFLGWHLGHGFASAFRSLGVHHPKYNAIIHWAGVLFAIAMAVGFMSFPLWAHFYVSSG